MKGEHYKIVKNRKYGQIVYNVGEEEARRSISRKSENVGERLEVTLDISTNNLDWKEANHRQHQKS